MADSDDRPEWVPPAEAAEMFLRDPESLVFLIGDFMTQFGLSWDELRSELAAGRLVAIGRPAGDIYSDVGITAKSLIAWLQNPESPQHLVDRAEASIRGAGTRQ